MLVKYLATHKPVATSGVATAKPATSGNRDPDLVKMIAIMSDMLADSSHSKAAELRKLNYTIKSRYGL